MTKQVKPESVSPKTEKHSTVNSGFLDNIIPSKQAEKENSDALNEISAGSKKQEGGSDD